MGHSNRKASKKFYNSSGSTSYMAPSIFKDPVQQAKFDKQGFLVAKFLDETEVTQLNDLFDEIHPVLPDDRGFVSDSYSNDFDFKKNASDRIVAILTKHFERLFINYQTFGASFLYKMPSKNNELGVHQDWTIVDEEKFVALNCWIPLIDVNKENGALHVLPGSHYSKIASVRSPTIPFFFTGSEKDVIDSCIPVYVKAGEAIILNQSVIHYSTPNHSVRIRKAITAGVKTKEAPMIFHYKSPEGQLEKFEMPEDFLLRFENFATSIFEKPVLGKLFATEKFENPIIEKEKLTKKLEKLKENAGFGPELSFMGRIRAVLNKAS